MAKNLQRAANEWMLGVGGLAGRSTSISLCLGACLHLRGLGFQLSDLVNISLAWALFGDAAHTLPDGGCRSQAPESENGFLPSRSNHAALSSFISATDLRILCEASMQVSVYGGA